MTFVEINEQSIPQTTLSFKSTELTKLDFLRGHDQWITDMSKLPLLLLEAAVQQRSSLYWELSRFSPKSLSRDLEHPDIRKKL